MPTGGVSPDYDNLKKWIDAGAVCVGMGSKLMAKNADGNFDYEKIEELTNQALDFINEIRTNS
jgi:2-dehydro-3-deoxyphosphogluconate aldolase/(4S)-4-hydroxy-2-oxoglutarate aldolase